ncbi:MAG: hypothetical protein ACI8UO_001743 [Verrucomicrobiales bacterium]|jgi:hypothetical protein
MISSVLRILTIFALLCSAASAKDYFLTIAGGYQPTANQISLEKNVIFYRNVLERAGLEEATHSVFFANGDSQNRDVQFEPTDAKIPKAQGLMARLLGSTKYQSLAYREHELTNLAGATTEENIAKWFDENAPKMQPGDRLIIYATAHGGASKDKAKEHNTTLFLWNRRTINVNQLQTHLEKLPEEVGTTLVMAQCHSGGFANSIFEGADTDEPDFERPVCGFFSTVHSRLAAGCTPDADEEDYDEFTSHFWAAINGQTRTGKPIQSADYDKNGAVDFEEAFAHTAITSRTIDIPIRTSGTYLRARSRYLHEDRENEQLLEQKSEYAGILALARPSEEAILEELSAHLKLTADHRYAQAERLANELEAKRKRLKAQMDEGKKRSEALKKTMQRELKEQWPELANILTEQSIRLMTTESEAFVKAVEALSQFEEWVKLLNEHEKISGERFTLEKEWALHIRFMRTHNNVVLAKNLRVLGDETAIERYELILDAERGMLGSDS